MINSAPNKRCYRLCRFEKYQLRGNMPPIRSASVSGIGGKFTSCHTNRNDIKSVISSDSRDVKVGFLKMLFLLQIKLRSLLNFLLLSPLLLSAVSYQISAISLPTSQIFFLLRSPTELSWKLIQTREFHSPQEVNDFQNRKFVCRFPI